MPFVEFVKSWGAYRPGSQVMLSDPEHYAIRAGYAKVLGENPRAAVTSKRKGRKRGNPPPETPDVSEPIGDPDQPTASENASEG